MQLGVPSGIPQPGEMFAGKYRIEQLLGFGGMGAVLSATHVHLEDRVAIKVLLPEVARRPESLVRFMREARATAKIRSEHVRRVLDVGNPEEGPPYLVLEYLQGADLSQIALEQGPLPVATAVDYILQTCEALAEAHGVGIVHRDLKPSNLFLTTRADGSPCVKVLDFGISKLGPSVDGVSGVITTTTDVLGSPFYTSPEQLRSTRDTDARTDIWSLGIILYELIAGGRPFQGGSMPEISAAILKDPLPPLRWRRTDVPLDLEQVVTRCLEKELWRRYSNVAELAHGLAPFGPPEARAAAERIDRVVRSSRVDFVPSVMVNGAARDGATATAAVWGKSEPRVKKEPHTWRLFGLAAAGALAVVVATGWVAGSRSRSVPRGDMALSPQTEIPKGDLPQAVSAPDSPATAIEPPKPLVDAPEVATSAAPSASARTPYRVSPVKSRPSFTPRPSSTLASDRKN